MRPYRSSVFSVPRWLEFPHMIVRDSRSRTARGTPWSARPGRVLLRARTAGLRRSAADAARWRSLAAVIRTGASASNNIPKGNIRWTHTAAPSQGIFYAQGSNHSYNATDATLYFHEFATGALSTLDSVPANYWIVRTAYP